jgi:DUF971 family protein
MPDISIVAGQLRIDWPEGRTELDGNRLRRECRCAECRALQLRGGKVEAHDVVVHAATPLGYGLQLHFSDGHARGVFPWNYLRSIGAG